MIKSGLILFAALLISALVFAQNTVGLIRTTPFKVQDGYNLIFPHNQGSVFLLNNCGQIVNEWADSVYGPGNSAMLNSDGNLVAGKGRGPQSNPLIHAGGGGELLEIRDWENNLLWQWAYNDTVHRLHHDFTLLPNGNILAISWERFVAQDAIAAGRDSNLLPDGSLWSEKVIEVKPIGADSAEIVWEWRAWDHLIQDFDSTKANFGHPSDHPELIDINMTPDGADDWLHINAIDYNEQLDQIMLSVPTLSEIWIIDHSTTTAQAASHSGGLGGRGGDLMFRWGNPQIYGQGTPSDEKLHYQHHCHWIGFGLSNSDPNFGKIMVFNNRVGADYSNVNIIDPVFDTYSWSYEMADGRFLPSDFDWTYERSPRTDMHSDILSSAQRLRNGNTLICAGRNGYAFEIDKDEEVVWEYVTPLSGGNPVDQGTMLNTSANLTFRMTRYYADHPALIDRDLSPKGYIETSPNESFCDSILILDEVVLKSDLKLFPNPVSNRLTIVTDRSESAQLFDAFGRLLIEFPLQSGEQAIDIGAFENGQYILRIGTEVRKLIVQH